jgi:biotin-(acetyl-CoA carboxylase) ligase
VNLNEDMTRSSDPEIQKNATSAYNMLGHSVVRELFLANLCNSLEELLCKQMDELIQLYKQYDILIGKEIIVMPKGRNDPERREAKALGFTKEGALQVQFKDDINCSIKTLISEEVSIRFNNNL